MIVLSKIGVTDSCELARFTSGFTDRRSALLSLHPTANNTTIVTTSKPTKAEAEEAVRTLLKYAGEDPNREGLLETPKRVVNSYDEFYRGYNEDPREYLSRTFEEVNGYDEMVVLRDIPFESHCEHHMAPIIGRAHVGYLPKNKVVGISKLARVVETYAKRLQVQEKMTAQIADCIQDILEPYGVGVVIQATHECMSTRGVHKHGVSMVTSRMAGAFRQDEKTRREFLAVVGPINALGG